MAVQTGEGTTDIIYGSASFPGGALTHSGYLARPDGVGEWPTVMVFGPDLAPSSTVKNLCRVLARHAIAALSPTLVGDNAVDERAIRSIARFIGNPTGDWSNAEYGFGLLAFGSGAAPAARLAATDGRAIAMAMVASELGDAVTADLVDAEIQGLYIGSRSDEGVDLDAVLDRRDALPQTTFVAYASGGEGFWNDDAAGFDLDRYEDMVERIVDFFRTQLPPRV